MTQHPLSPGDLFASLRAAAQAESVARAHRPGALEAVVLALVIRLCTQLEQLFSQWQSSPASQPGAPRLTRVAALPFIPRALRQPPLPDWLVRLYPGRGARPAPAPRPQSRSARAHPPRNAPH
jgi:hypothetical protein